MVPVSWYHGVTTLETTQVVGDQMSRIADPLANRVKSDFSTVITTSDDAEDI